ncbi:hypothetical protein MMC08_007220 [Hypocenomyce scalaris]|nr:hypothetical protein [Hypocenomyce scalaris]
MANPSGFWAPGFDTTFGNTSTTPFYDLSLIYLTAEEFNISDEALAAIYRPPPTTQGPFPGALQAFSFAETEARDVSDFVSQVTATGQYDISAASSSTLGEGVSGTGRQYPSPSSTSTSSGPAVTFPGAGYHTPFAPLPAPRLALVQDSTSWLAPLPRPAIALEAPRPIRPLPAFRVPAPRNISPTNAGEGFSGAPPAWTASAAAAAAAVAAGPTTGGTKRPREDSQRAAAPSPPKRGRRPKDYGKTGFQVSTVANAADLGHSEGPTEHTRAPAPKRWCGNFKRKEEEEE